MFYIDRYRIETGTSKRYSFEIKCPYDHISIELLRELLRVALALGNESAKDLQAALDRR
jgi:hypothetical protein